MLGEGGVQSVVGSEVRDSRMKLKLEVNWSPAEGAKESAPRGDTPREHLRLLWGRGLCNGVGLELIWGRDLCDGAEPELLWGRGLSERVGLEPFWGRGLSEGVGPELLGGRGLSDEAGPEPL